MRRTKLMLLGALLLCSTSRAATILEVTGYRTNSIGDFIVDISDSVDPATVPEAAILPPVTPLLAATAEFGKLSVFVKVSTTDGTESLGSSRSLDIVNAPIAGSLVLPVIIFADFTRSFDGDFGELFNSMTFSLANLTSGESGTVDKYHAITVLGGVEGGDPQQFETPSSAAVTFTALAGYPDAYYASNIEIPVVAGDNEIQMELTAVVNCFPASGDLCEITGDLSKTLYLGPTLYFDPNKDPLDPSLLTSSAGLNYARGTVVDRAGEGEVPEPSTWALSLLGLAVLAWCSRRQA